MVTRRQFLLRTSMLIPLFGWAGLRERAQAASAPTATVAMRGTPRGERVWFEPQGIAVAPGQTLRFLNEDAANVHTATAFHPSLHGRERRIPAAAEPWTSELLMPGQYYDLTLHIPGVYDYYCLPHAAHGMVGRIVVGSPEDAKWTEENYYRLTQATGMPGTFPPWKELIADPQSSRAG